MERQSRKKRPLKKKVTEWVAWLIGRGHLHAFSYGINFLQTAIKESYHQNNEAVIANSISHRISNLEPKDYAKAIEEILPTPIPVVDHSENIKRFGKK